MVPLLRYHRSVLQQRSFALELSARFKARLSQHFGDRLVEVRLFGSRARGEAHEESDLDVLVLVRGLTRQEKIDVFGLASELGIDAGISISALAMTPEELDKLRALEARIAIDIDREGISA
jgi:predicted nucleotidyltransferase